MIDYQYGSFQIQSSLMHAIIENLKQAVSKKYFIVVGNTGTGKTTMINYINRVIFDGVCQNIFDETNIPNVELDNAIIATSHDLFAEIVAHFDRTQAHIIEMPSLIERKADIAPFAHFFIEVLSLMHNQKPFKLTEKAIEKLLQYNWPGNFIELEGVLERAFQNSLVNETHMGSKCLIEPEQIELENENTQVEFTVGQKLDEVERKYILQTLYFVHQNRTRAAEILGISIRTLRNKINQYREEGYL